VYLDYLASSLTLTDEA